MSALVHMHDGRVREFFADLPHFTPEEIACRHCQRIVWTPESRKALSMLQQLRFSLGLPLRVVSGSRCPTHNRAVKGAEASYHLFGRAFDLAVDVAPNHADICRAGLLCGFRGFGFYSGFVHIDTGAYRTWVGS